MALLSKSLLKALTSIELLSNENFIPCATGYLVGFLELDSEEPNEREYRLFLVTNRHVFEGKTQVFLRFNKSESNETVRFPIQLVEEGAQRWLAHKDNDVDLAMIPVSHEVLTENEIDWSFYQYEMVAEFKNFDDIGISIGDEIYTLGFPMGLSGRLKNYPIVRGGLIARVDEEITANDKCFLIDSAIFPGNSGGPVLLKPELTSTNDSTAVGSTYIIGTISGYLPYREELYSHQSQPPRVGAVSIENSGLALVVPMDYAREIFEDFKSAQMKLEEVETGIERAAEAPVSE